MKKRMIWKAIPALALATTLLLSACGKSELQGLTTTKTETGSVNAYLYTKPKLDLVIFQDNSDSMANAMAQVKPQFNSFIAGLDTNWEYRVIVLPLLSQQSLSQKLVLATNCSGVPAGSCTTSASDFNSRAGDQGWINSRDSSVGNQDLGFQNMVGNMNNLSGFRRQDAALAMVVLSNGEDNSGVAYNYRSDGALIGINYSSSTTINSFNSYLNAFRNYQATLSINKFYAVVAANNYSDCYGGGRTWMGKRYMDMAGSLNGFSFDLCSSGLSNVLGSLRSSLQVMVQSFIFDYIVLSEAPNPSTIEVTKNGAAVPNDSVNGWTYAGYKVNEPTSNTPVANSYVKTGYMIRLNGTAKLSGSDSYSVKYQK